MNHDPTLFPQSQFSKAQTPLQKAATNNTGLPPPSLQPKGLSSQKEQDLISHPAPAYKFEFTHTKKQKAQIKVILSLYEAV